MSLVMKVKSFKINVKFDKKKMARLCFGVCENEHSVSSPFRHSHLILFILSIHSACQKACRVCCHVDKNNALVYFWGF